MKKPFLPFECFIAWKYLIPKKKTLSTSLISFLSLSVIALVIWLILLFLSVTTGIEKNWLKKLTTVQAPLRVYPSNHYLHSYYYLIDAHSAASSYSLKSISEKLHSEKANPYDPDQDMELPFHFPSPDKEELLDPVKKVFAGLEKLQREYPTLVYQEYEFAAALMRLQTKSSAILSQVNYLATFPSHNPNLSSLLIIPTMQQVQELLFTSSSKELCRILPYLKIEEAKSKSGWVIPTSFHPKKGEIRVYAEIDKGTLSALHLFPKKKEWIQGKLSFEKEEMHFRSSSLNVRARDIPLIAEDPIFLTVNDLEKSFPYQASLSFSHEGVIFSGTLFLQQFEIVKGSIINRFSSVPKRAPLWPFFVNGIAYLNKWEEKEAILLPKSYKEQGVALLSRGTLSYTSQSSLSGQEMKVPFYVAGFYDPGVLPVGSRCLFAEKDLVRSISAQSPALSIDGTPTNGIFLWYDNLKEAPLLKEKLRKVFEEEGVSSYWSVESFYDFSFSKDLLQQFQSDRTLFTLLAMIIILVACSNVISFLILLVNDKKKEIAIMRAMGASKKSIALIFGLIGFVVGSISTAVGTLFALFTLKNLSLVVSFLSKIQGHQAFQPAFFGDTLPNSLSIEAFTFILIATPLLSIVAALIPAIKAARLHCSQTLRSDG